MGVTGELAAYAEALRDVSQAAEGVHWSRTLDALAKLPDDPPGALWGKGADPLGAVMAGIGWFSTLTDACALFFRDVWLTRIRASSSESVYRQLREQRQSLGEQLLKLASEVWTGWVAQTAKLSASEVGRLLDAGIAQLQKTFSATLVELLVCAADLETGSDRASRLVLIREITIAQDDDAVSASKSSAVSHPLLQQALTFGGAPKILSDRTNFLVDLSGDRGESGLAGDFTVLEASLPRSRIVLYDLFTLLKGVPGSAVSGLNYHLVRNLNTIRFLDDPPELAPDPAKALDGAHFLRVDASGHPTIARPVATGPPLEVLSGGPPAVLRKYHELAGLCVEDPDSGFRISNAEAMLALYEEVEGDTPLHRLENTRLEAELSYTRRYYKSDQEAAAPALSASAIVTSRYDRTLAALEQQLPVQKLPGEAESRKLELSLTYLKQAEQLEERLGKVPTASATKMAFSNIERLLVFRLTDEGVRLPALKTACSVIGRGPLLN